MTMSCAVLQLTCESYKLHIVEIPIPTTMTIMMMLIMTVILTLIILAVIVLAVTRCCSVNAGERLAPVYTPLPHKGLESCLTPVAAESSAAALKAGPSNDENDVGDAAAIGDAVDDDDADCPLTTRRSGDSEPPSTDARAIKRQGLSYLSNRHLHNHAEFDSRDYIHEATVRRRARVASSPRFCFRFAQEI
jgi:hypothetical protein